MSEPVYTFSRSDETAVTIKLAGRLDEAASRRLERALVIQWPDLMPRADRPRVLVDMRALDVCEAGARAALIRVQRFLCRRGARTAYVASQPRLRGLALYVAHMAADPGAKPAPTLASAQAWLDATAERLADAEQRTESLLQVCELRVDAVGAAWRSR